MQATETTTQFGPNVDFRTMRRRLEKSRGGRGAFTPGGWVGWAIAAFASRLLGPIRAYEIGPADVHAADHVGMVLVLFISSSTSPRDSAIASVGGDYFGPQRRTSLCVQGATSAFARRSPPRRAGRWRDFIVCCSRRRAAPRISCGRRHRFAL